MKLAVIILISLSAILMACRSDSGDHAARQAEEVYVGPDAHHYLTNLLDTLQRHSVRRDSIDWDRLRADVLHQAQDAETPAETYDAVRFALQQLGDRHSFFMTPEHAEAMWESGMRKYLTPTGDLLDGNVGYIVQRTFMVTDSLVAVRYASALQQLIEEIDGQHPCGWIVDLRGNSGGNMWAMLVGLGPLIGEGRAGMVVDADGNATGWYYTDGEARLDTTILAAMEGDAYRLKQASAPIAVLTGPMTGSSGEAMAVAFRGRTNTRSFGQPTAGGSSGNKGFRLSDGAAIALTVSLFADRDGRVYGGRIEPDTLVEGDPMGVLDPVKEAATAWLKRRPACR